MWTSSAIPTCELHFPVNKACSYICWCLCEGLRTPSTKIVNWVALSQILTHSSYQDDKLKREYRTVGVVRQLPPLNV